MRETKHTPSCNHGYQLIKDLRDFMQDVLSPAITSRNEHDMERASWQRDKVLEAIYVRIATWLLTFEKLNSASDMQAIGSGARAMFELHVDLVWIEHFGNAEWIRRFTSFPIVERYLAAQKVIDFKSANPDSLTDDTPHKAFIAQQNEESEKLEARVVKIWGKTGKGKVAWPREHWTGYKLAERTQKLGIRFEEARINMYWMFCSLVHAGPTPFMGGLDWAEVQIAACYFHAFLYAWNSTRKIVHLMQLATRVPQWDAFEKQMHLWIIDAERAAGITS